MPGLSWTGKEMDSLITQVMVQGRKLPQLVIPDRTSAAISNLMGHLRQSGRLNDRLRRKVRPWTAEEIFQLKERVEAGGSAKSIYQENLFGERQRSVDSISQKMRRLGLGNPKEKEKAKNARRLTPRESQARCLGLASGKRSHRQIVCIQGSFAVRYPAGRFFVFML
jgi:hypothetical protein